MLVAFVAAGFNFIDTADFYSPTGYTLPPTGTVTGTYQWDATYIGGTDNSAVSDNNAVKERVVVSASILADGSFESPSVGSGSSAYVYDPTGSPWAYTGGAGVSGNGSGFTSGNPNAPQGSQVAFVQTTGSVSQSVTFAAGTYTVSFSGAQRATYQACSQTVEVLIDGTAVATITPSGTSYATYTTGTYTVTAGSHTLSFVGLNPTFLDAVRPCTGPCRFRLFRCRSRRDRRSRPDRNNRYRRLSSS